MRERGAGPGVRATPPLLSNVTTRPGEFNYLETAFPGHGTLTLRKRRLPAIKKETILPHRTSRIVKKSVPFFWRRKNFISTFFCKAGRFLRGGYLL